MNLYAAQKFHITDLKSKTAVVPQQLQSKASIEGFQRKRQWRNRKRVAHL